MRAVIALSAVLVAQAASTQSLAATRSYRLTVSSYVEASCSIDTRALLARPDLAVGSAVKVCAQAGPATIPMPPARVVMTNDEVTGLSMLAIEF